MKVIAAVGTMRKNGDSYHMIQKIEERLRRESSIEMEYLFLSDYDLGYCRGCCACFNQGEESCPKRELTGPIEEKLVGADGIIIASPVYDHQVTAIMKNFFDHFAYFYHRPRFFGKPAILLSTTGASGLKETLDYLSFTATGWGFKPVAKLGVISPLYQRKESYKATIDADIELAAREFSNLISSKAPTKPKLYDLIFFSAMRMKAERNPCDRKYWEERGWLKSSYFVQAPINPIRRIAAKIIEAKMRASINRMIKPDPEPQRG
jgi:multimeric flavodoxin WrbA